MLLRVEGLRKSFGSVPAVRGVSFGLERGQTCVLLGESGSGKSTLARLILGLLKRDEGHVFWENEEIKGCHPLKMQMIFQDPWASLDPKLSIGQIIAEPLRVLGLSSRQRVDEVASWVGIETLLERYPHECSGGQRQRVGLARALVFDPVPSLIIADEPVSALDLSVQAQILNLMRDLRNRHNLSYLWITHDWAVAAYMGDVCGVMYAGSLVEWGPMDHFRNPLHPYTKGLKAAIPNLSDRQVPPPPFLGELGLVLKGCPFAPRCPLAQEVCRQEAPSMRQVGEGQVACHFV
jgi:oligopeptide/dipeptide ABC transporter ATP-binding protein